MLYLAPLQGLTDLSFRKAHAETFGNVIDFAVSPFISLTHGDSNSNIKKLKDVLPEFNQDVIPLIPQILGNNPEHFLALADTLRNMGYSEVNWNLGCPVKRVSNKKRGSGLLPYPQLIDSFLDAVFSKINQNVSLKIRLGYYTEYEIFKLLPIFKKYPLKSITIHPRIGLQMYEGRLFLEILRQCIPQIECPVIFNGDILHQNDIQKIYSLFPEIKDVMIGRGLIRNPLLAGMAKNIIYEKNQTDLIKKFIFALFYQLKQHKASDSTVLNKMKEYWSYFALNFEKPQSILCKVQSAESLYSLENTINHSFKMKLQNEERLSYKK